MNSSFLEKLIDWKDFELFVADIYKQADEVLVEHDVTLTGKSNARRQIDVLVTQTTKLHKYTTLIECKRWKTPVTRQVIDVLSASIEDLNASKGVIFTTKGYEEGAVEYAKSKNIDIFIIRDILESEYGKPGKAFSLYIQEFNAKLDNFDVQSNIGSLYGKELLTPPKFNVIFSKNQEYPKNQNLYNDKGVAGSHLLKILIQVRKALLDSLYNSFDQYLTPDEIGYKTRVTIEFKDYDFRHMIDGDYIITLNSLSFDLYRQIKQSIIHQDRTESMDFALVVENYVTKQRNFVS